MATLFRDTRHHIDWGWYSDNARRLHLRALGYPASCPFPVWLEKKGARVFELDGSLRDYRNIAGYEEGRAREIFDRLRKFLEESGREHVERIWLWHLLQRGRLVASLDDHDQLIVTVHPGTRERRTKRVNVRRHLERVAGRGGQWGSARLTLVESFIDVSRGGDGHGGRGLGERGPTAVVTFAGPGAAKACVVVALSDILFRDAGHDGEGAANTPLLTR